MNLYERAKNGLEILAGYNFGEYPLVFVCHSLGGLLVKQILRTAKESADEDWHKVADNCVGVIFLATPHTGSSLANLLKAFSGCFSSPHVDKLLKDSSDLDELNASFRAFCHQREIGIAVYYEMHKTGRVAMVVDSKSADPGVNGSMPVPVDSDHINICKPVDRHSVVYLGIRRHLKTLLPNTVAVPPEQREAFEEDDLDDSSATDRRDLHTKMMAAGREHEYAFANDSQNKFARSFTRSGLMTGAAKVHGNLLADIEQRFQSLIFHPLICSGADNATISAAILTEIIDPLSVKYAGNDASAKTIMNALYFLTERCHVRWDRP